MFDNNRFFKSIKLKNFLTYGEEGVEIDCLPLNVFIGPNTSGKSNFIEAVKLLSNAPIKGPVNQIANFLSLGGGVSEYIWKGGPEDAVAHIEVITESYSDKYDVRYTLEFRSAPMKGFELFHESLIRQKIGVIPYEDHQPDYYYTLGEEPSLVTYVNQDEKERVEDKINDYLGYADIRSLDLNRSILAQKYDYERFPNISYIGDKFQEIKIYRDLNLGFKSPIKSPTDTESYPDFLWEDAHNIWLILHNLFEDTGLSNIIYDYVKKFSPYVEHINPSIKYGKVQFFIHERGNNRPVSIGRHSDGFIRFLCLLAILCHPEPPSVICIEEPEICMHPDVIHIIAELLKEASQRTQIFVTTHSDHLISALADTPESVVVCNRFKSGTYLRRLEREQLQEWLKKYTLGDLWCMGEIGGVT